MPGKHFYGNYELCVDKHGRNRLFFRTNKSHHMFFWTVHRAERRNKNHESINLFPFLLTVNRWKVGILWFIFAERWPMITISVPLSLKHLKTSMHYINWSKLDNFLWWFVQVGSPLQWQYTSIHIVKFGHKCIQSAWSCGSHSWLTRRWPGFDSLSTLFFLIFILWPFPNMLLFQITLISIIIALILSNVEYN